MWLERLDFRSLDRNLANCNANPRFYHTATRKPTKAKEYVSHLVCLHIRLTATESSIHLKSLALRCCIVTTIYKYNYTHIHAETKSTIMTNEHSSLEKYTSHTLCERVMCKRWVGDWTDSNILTLSSSAFSSTSFLFYWATQPGVLKASWFSLQHLYSNSLNLSVAPGYIIVWNPPASCGRYICTQFNPSTVKFIPWYLWPDVPIMNTGASLIWQFGRGSVCYNAGGNHYFLR